MTEGQTHVQETDVAVAPFVGIADGMPEGDGIGVEGDIALAPRGRIPEVGVALGIGADGAADDALAHQGDEQLAMSLLHHPLEEAVGRDIASRLQQVMAAQQS